MSLSYFNVKKLRRQSKQHEFVETTTPATDAAVDTAVDNAVEKPTTPPAPAVTTPSQEPAAEPVLDEEDEKFLARLAAISNEPEGTPPPLPTRPGGAAETGEKQKPRDAQEALMDGADKVPLPMSPTEGTSDNATKRKSMMSYFALAQARFKKATEKSAASSSNDETKKDKKKASNITAKDKEKAADSLLAAAQSAKTADQLEKAKEEQDLTAILDDLNLSAVNNRVFSFSAESEVLFNKFTLVLKDIVNGVPTAYDDLEKLFTEYDVALRKMYGGLPPFLQNMVKSLPAKMTAVLGPEILAASAEKPGFDAKQRGTFTENVKGAAKGAAKKRAQAKIPSLKALLSAEGAVATMLRSILNFLKLRFPAVMTGTNVVMSLAVCLLLFVFWYCHKRGRETRIEKEKLAAEDAEGGESNLASSASSINSEADSVFGPRAKQPTATSAGPSSSRPDGEADRAQPPLVISDETDEAVGAPQVTVNDMPSVKDLPPPGTAPK